MAMATVYSKDKRLMMKSMFSFLILHRRFDDIFNHSGTTVAAAAVLPLPVLSCPNSAILEEEDEEQGLFLIITVTVECTVNLAQLHKPKDWVENGAGERGDSCG
jgi:hypothetical protein